MTKLAIITGCFFFFLAANTCFTNSSNSKNNDEMNVSLKQELVELGYQKLFLASGDKDLKRIWANGKNEKSLYAIISGETSSQEEIFLAAEVGYYFNAIPNKKDFSTLASAYAFALENTSFSKKNTVRLNGNQWGFLYKKDDTGELGKRFLEFGTASIEPLKKLLDDNNNLLFEGSQEAMIGNDYQYRIKDFAAFYIHKITNIPIQFYQELEKRDDELEKFKTILNKHQDG